MLENKIPPPLVALFIALVMWLVSSLLPTFELAAIVRLSIVAVLLMLAIFFSFSGVISFRRAKTTVNPLKPESATSLVDSGIYQITRNPMYVGFALCLLAWAVYLSSPYLIFGVFGFVAYLTRFQIIPEERALTDIFGDDFMVYKGKVRRWL